jgi:hypothetical protein
LYVGFKSLASKSKSFGAKAPPTKEFRKNCAKILGFVAAGHAMSRSDNLSDRRS